ncbi:DUF2786 domain-containing protein [Actinacidiphila soli]|uniref:DUF2786 domain-containing protein n=1 Tax=Actinacidiphila soli TaxID=2487275 RepID=UPI000FCA7D59|nr:DUF2786 domain-containing protein [Actinacidiphila soli]
MGKKKQERRRGKKKEREARQRARSTGPGSTFGNADPGPFEGPYGYVPPPRERSLVQVVEAALRRVLEAPDDGVAVAVGKAAAVLSDPAGRWPEVGRALLVLADSMIDRLWANGWQPADLVRIVRRELSARHTRLAVDLIAAESRKYAPASLDPRWSDQLREVGAKVWWEADDTFLPGYATREKLDRLATATCALEVLRLLGWLPGITPVGPPPGAGGGNRWRRGQKAGSGDEPRMLGRIRALLAKAESTEFTEEADALTAKAQQLMAQHSISEALITADTGREDAPGACRIGVDNPYEQTKVMLLDAVATANRCRAVWSRHLGFSTVIGFDADLDAVELLYTSLLVQANAALGRAGSRQRADGSSRTRSFRQSFLLAYATRIRERLTVATEQATNDAVAGTSPLDEAAGAASKPEPRLLPVLAAREEAVNDATEQMFPELTTTRSVRANDGEGWAQGTAAADRATLHGHAGAIRADG